MTRSSTRQPSDAPAAAPPRCPRCGARLGTLGDAQYCGCCGLVASATVPPAEPTTH